MDKLHEKLRAKHPKYDAWHNNPRHKVWHWSAFIIVGQLALIAMLMGTSGISSLASQASNGGMVTVSLISPASGSVYATNVPLNMYAEASSGQGIYSIGLYLDNRLVFECRNTSNSVSAACQYTLLPPLPLSRGQHSAWAKTVTTTRSTKTSLINRFQVTASGYGYGY